MFVYWQLVVVFYCVLDFVNIGEVDLWVYILGEQVEFQCDQVYVVGVFVVVEQVVFDLISFGCEI